MLALSISCMFGMTHAIPAQTACVGCTLVYTKELASCPIV